MVSLHSTDGIPQQYWWYPSTVLMASLTNVIIQQYCHILWIILNCHLHPFSSPQGSRISARWGCYWFSLSSSFPSAVYSTRISKIVVAVNHHSPPQRLHWSQVTIEIISVEILHALACAHTFVLNYTRTFCSFLEMTTINILFPPQFYMWLFEYNHIHTVFS